MPAVPPAQLRRRPLRREVAVDDVTAGGFIAAGLVVFFAAWWWIDRIIHPKTWCSTCSKTGRLNSPWSVRWRDCPNCQGGVRDRRT